MAAVTSVSGAGSFEATGDPMSKLAVTPPMLHAPSPARKSSFGARGSQRLEIQPVALVHAVDRDVLDALGRRGRVEFGELHPFVPQDLFAAAPRERGVPLAVAIAFERSSSDEPFLGLGSVPLVFSDDVQADWVVNVWDPSVAENAGRRRDHGE